MDQMKIGKFISTKRKEKKITQSELAEKLNITNRAISKWENGFCSPDASNMLDLCKILDIKINDLFSGEIVDMKDNEKILEENLLEMTRMKEQRDKELLWLELFIGIIVSIFMLTCIFLATFIDMPNWLKVSIIIISIVQFAFGISYVIRIEQIAGYYECDKYHYQYIPSYKSVLFACHINRTRKMKCPQCHKKLGIKKY